MKEKLWQGDYLGGFMLKSDWGGKLHTLFSNETEY